MLQEQLGILEESLGIVKESVRVVKFVRESRTLSLWFQKHVCGVVPEAPLDGEHKTKT